MMDETQAPIIIFEDDDKAVEVRLDTDRETVWLTQEQMTVIFDVQKAAVSKHLKNIYQDGELEREATVSILETVRAEGKRKVIRQIEHYNLDAIISVGYRVNSRRAVLFRQWANGSTCKDFLTVQLNTRERAMCLGGPDFLIGF